MITGTTCQNIFKILSSVKLIQTEITTANGQIKLIMSSTDSVTLISLFRMEADWISHNDKLL